jgi:hypothetical protein
MTTFADIFTAEAYAAKMGPAYTVRPIVNTLRTTSGAFVMENIVFVVEGPAPTVLSADDYAAELSAMFNIA